MIKNHSTVCILRTWSHNVRMLWPRQCISKIFFAVRFRYAAVEPVCDVRTMFAHAYMHRRTIIAIWIGGSKWNVQIAISTLDGLRSIQQHTPNIRIQSVYTHNAKHIQNTRTCIKWTEWIYEKKNKEQFYNVE